jgi:hypothetical protein
MIQQYREAIRDLADMTWTGKPSEPSTPDVEALPKLPLIEIQGSSPIKLGKCS